MSKQKLYPIDCRDESRREKLTTLLRELRMETNQSNYDILFSAISEVHCQLFGGENDG